ncbi:DNA mismatch repair protein MutS [Pirellula staleyi DSM 6068]|uniref:DNA mismatch repair protein MutS n=1 Tax=Pirellula staleyi (strain ATCC 27377 / DSM 6068 / ICPB 4128) TaxID=530564 RepID=D2R469_PIRSD|nr:DNA mismatch repair protein MutS [Pirellula staleyi]ADB18918.1 DNA mismatch repair protein MutS [Pirellula staleyi DSM 6068]
MAVTPMMQQYLDAKQACGDALLLFRMGDFYELFHDDARTASRVLGLTLTTRDKGENPVPMAGFPYHQLEGYLAKLIGGGLRAAVCEQVEDPRQAKGLVKREVTRVVTPGTLTDDALLDPRESNYLAAMVLPDTLQPHTPVGLAWADLSTGRFQAAVFPFARLGDELARLQPSECLLGDDQPPPTCPFPPRMMITRRPEWTFARDTSQAVLQKQLQVASLEGFGFDESDMLAIRAAGGILEYLRETQKTSLDHIDRLLPYRSGESLEIDEATRRSLEITRTFRSGAREGSLLSVIDQTITPPGSRLLADWVGAPLTNLAAIGARQDAVELLRNSATVRRQIREELAGVYDLERLIARVTTLRASPRDLAFVGRTLARLPQLKALVAHLRAPLLDDLQTRLDESPALRDLLAAALEDDCPLLARDGNFIRQGFHGELDRLREMAHGGKAWIARYQADQIEKTGIPNLKVAFNKVFGYYIEITNAQKEKTPPEYIRKQTVASAERYITPELKEYEEKVLTADERSKELEYQLFVELRDKTHQFARALRMTAAAIAELDVLAALAQLADRPDYCRPVMTEDQVVEIVEGRHPVLDAILPRGTFVPNDTTLGTDGGLVMLITGPNMAGKSTYIRQVAVLSLLAHVGSFLPASRATIGICDRIFARVGASDELSRGQSTFMVEMTETARILNSATARSLVILDEIGRGTSTYDGISLAWAIVEHLHDQIGCRTLFATHYHELTDLAGSLAGVRNLSVAVREWQDQVVLLHKIVPGAADKSYGIHCARLAGVPRSVNERAKQILAKLEGENLDTEGRPKLIARTKKSRKGDLQLTLFAPEEHPLLEQLRQLDLAGLTPLQAMQWLANWQQEIGPKK